MGEFELSTISPALLAALLAFCGGLVLGIAAREGRFCTLAAIEDVLFGGNAHRWRMWVTAMAVAMALTHLLLATGTADFSNSFYVTRPVNLVTTILGGLMFGVGMALVGTCAFGTVVRLGGGDLKSFVVFLVVGISAFMAAAGPTAQLRVAVLDPFAFDRLAIPDPRLDAILSAALGLPSWLVISVVAAALLWWVLSDASFRDRPLALAWGILVGTVIAYGWWVTGAIARDPFEPVPVASYAFVQSLGASVMYAMTSSGATLGFGIGGVAGVLVGSAGSAWRRNEWRWEAADDANEARRQIVGAFLMGTGGMYALGCTIGQGLSAMSLLIVTAPLALAAIWFGAYLGLTFLMAGSLRGCFQGFRFGRG